MKNKSSKQENIFVTEEEKTINWPIYNLNLEKILA